MTRATHWPSRVLILALQVIAVLCLQAEVALHTQESQRAGFQRGETYREEYRRPAASKDINIAHPKLLPRSPHEPTQVHLSLAGDGRLAVSWVTSVIVSDFYSFTSTAASVCSTCKFGRICRGFCDPNMLKDEHNFSRPRDCLKTCLLHGSPSCISCKD